MSWLKRIEPIVVAQSSEVPYVILENGVFLCFDNFYYNHVIWSDHYIKFIAPKDDINQQSTNCFCLKSFPKLIQFENIINLDHIIENGKIVSTSMPTAEDSKHVFIIKSEYLQKLEENEIQEILNIIDEYDDVFLLTGDELSQQDRILGDGAKTIIHSSWYKTFVSIFDQIIADKSRGYCWTKSISELSLTIHGIKNRDESAEAHECLDNLGITEKEVCWV